MKHRPKNKGTAGGAFALLALAALAAEPAQAQQVTGVLGSPSATTTIEGNQIPVPPSQLGGGV